VGGGDNDDINRRDEATKSLVACPYVQQVLFSFNTVWSRSRFMRIAGGASVPPHGDMNRHWFDRVRVHIAVVTRPEVCFHCGGVSVHMAAGEAWIFDNWLEHRVENPSPDARIHLSPTQREAPRSGAWWAKGQSADLDRAEPARPDWSNSTGRAAAAAHRALQRGGGNAARRRSSNSRST
jgi:hypothetical protein